jgi:hypothetical protein
LPRTHLPTLLSLALAACAAAACAAAGERPAERRPGPSARLKLKRGQNLVFTFQADQMLPIVTGDFPGKASVLSGSAWVYVKGRYRGRVLDTLLEAENIVIFHRKVELTDKRTGRKRRETEVRAWAEGAVRLTDREGRLLCSDLYYNFRNHRGRARNVRFEVGRFEAVPTGRPPAGTKLFAEEDPAVEDRWSIGFRAAPVRKWYLSAPEIRRAGPGRWTLIGPKISSCGFQEPHWCFRASSANYLPGRRVESFNNVLKLEGLPVFYFPYLARDLKHDYPWTHWQFGSSSEWGPYVLSKWGLDLPSGEGWILQPRNLFLDADWRQNRGFAYGADLRYATLPHGGGLIDTYFIREDHISGPEDSERAEEEFERRTAIYDDLQVWGAPKIRGLPKLHYGENLLFVQRRTLDGFGPATPSRDLRADEQRFRLTVRQRHDLMRVRSPLHHEPIYKLDFTVEYHDYSDRDFAREYFRDEYRYGPPPVSYAMLRNQSDVMSAAIVVQPKVDPFMDQTEYLPEVRFNIPQRPLPGGFYLASRGSLGKLYRHFDEDSGFEGFKAGRAHLEMIGWRPCRLGPITFNPYVGTDQAWYSDHFRDGDVIRGALIYGADASVKFYGVFATESQRLNIHGLRHVVEPRIFFRGTSEPTRRVHELYDFDERDDIFKHNVVGAGLFQKFQVKRRGRDGKLRTADFCGVDYIATGFADQHEADEYNSGDMLLPMEVRGFFSPVQGLKLWSRLEIDAHGAGVTGSTSGVGYSREDRFAISLGHRMTTEDERREIKGSNYVTGRIDVALNELYRLSAGARYEFEDPDEDLGEKGFDQARVELIRDLHCWRLGVGYSEERRDDDINRSVTLTVSPTGRPTNLVKGSDQLLRDEPDYSRMPWRARPGEAAGALRLLPPEEPPDPPREIYEDENE